MRTATHEPQHLLDTSAEQNIGNGVTIQPSAGLVTVIPQAKPARILQLTGQSKRGQTTSIVLTASRIVGPRNPNPEFPGPVTGIIEFGKGGQFTRAEVDIPIGPLFGATYQAANAVQSEDGGVIITVPTGELRAYARYDNNLIQSPINLSTPTTIAQHQGVTPVIGPGAPANVGGTIIPPEPVQVRAMAALFGHHRAKAYRTHYLYVGDTSTGSLWLTPIAWYCFCIPPFAGSGRVLRFPSVAITINLFDNMNALSALESEIQIPANTSPIIPLSGTETIVQVMTPNAPSNTTPLPFFVPTASPSSGAPSPNIERHPEFSGGASAAVVSFSSLGMAAQQQLPAASKTVSGDRSSGASAAVVNVSAGGSPQEQLPAGMPRDVFPALANLSFVAGPPAGIQESQLRSNHTLTITVK